MLDAVVAVAAGLFVLAGLAVMLGPSLPRVFHFLRRRRPAIPGVEPRTAGLADQHPTTQRALLAAAQLIRLLRGQGMERQAAALRLAGRKLSQDEPAGLYAMQQVLRHLRSLELEDAGSQDLYEELTLELGRAVSDRAEQLELLPKR